MNITNEIIKYFKNAQVLNFSFSLENPLPINHVANRIIDNTPIIIPGLNADPNCLLALTYSLPAPMSSKKPIIILNVFRSFCF